MEGTALTLILVCLVLILGLQIGICWSVWAGVKVLKDAKREAFSTLEKVEGEVLPAVKEVKRAAGAGADLFKDGRKWCGFIMGSMAMAGLSARSPKRAVLGIALEALWRALNLSGRNRRDEDVGDKGREGRGPQG